MKFKGWIALIAILFLITTGLSTADILPLPASENQIFRITSDVETTAQVQSETILVGENRYRGIDGDPPVRGGEGGASVESFGYVTYSDFILTNGGELSEVKSFLMDTHGKAAGRYNVETTKILTYTSQNGSHLMGEESYVLDVMGNWSYRADDILCVFSRSSHQIIPAFCNKATASSKLTSVTTAQVETLGKMTAIGRSRDVPAALSYEISVTPDANSASGYADGIVSTTFTISIMEGRSDGEITPPLSVGTDIRDLSYYTELAVTLTYIDTATVAGGISTFNKLFNYQSGVVCTNC
jgi:hypothetical protein